MVEISSFVASLSTLIANSATDYAADIDKNNRHEQALLDTFDTYVEAIVAEYNPPSARRRSPSLVFAHLYDAAGHCSPDEQGWRVSSALAAALLAAEIEFRGPLRLTARQNTELAGVYERLGKDLMVARLPGHAVRAFRRAAALFRINEDVEAEDRCGLQLAQAHTRALSPGWRRLARRLSYVLCGYGYRPFWLLAWVAVQLLVFMVIGLLVAGTSSAAETIYMCATSFLNPLGLGDTDNLRAAARPLFAVESWSGTVSMSVFFALLVRKWFRL